MTTVVGENVMRELKGVEAQYSDCVVSLVSAEGDYLYFSGQLFANSIHPSEKVGRSFADYVHPDDIALIRQSMQTALICDGCFSIRVRVRTRDGYEAIDRISKRLIDEVTGQFYLLNVATRASSA